MSNLIQLSEQKISDKIHFIRDKKVMLDFDLAELYGVTTGNLNKTVRHNKSRFPDDFMTRLTKKEYDSLRFQFGILKRGQHSKFLPYAFTQHGVAMLSSVLNSSKAIRVNIQIICVFSRMHELLLTHKDILLKLELLEKKILKQDNKMKKHELEIQLIFDTLKKLLNSGNMERKRVGYRLTNDKN
jgi:phage regulator Rha-like protein